MTQTVLDECDRPHRHDADQGRPEAKEQEQHIIASAQCHGARHLEQGLCSRNGVHREVSAQGRGGDRRQRLQRVAADDQLESVERAGERTVEGGGDGRGRSASDQQAQILAPQPERLPGLRGETGARLRIGGLQAGASAKAHGDHRYERQIQAVPHGHAPAIKRVRLDGIDDLVRPQVTDDSGREPHQHAADGRDKKGADGGDCRSSAQMAAGRDAE